MVVRNLQLLMFAIAGGLALSGIVANLYRLLATKPKTGVESWIYYGVMVVAGPSVLFDNAARSFRKKECTRLAFFFALNLATYWAMILGAIVLEMAIAV